MHHVTCLVVCFFRFDATPSFFFSLLLNCAQTHQDLLLSCTILGIWRRSLDGIFLHLLIQRSLLLKRSFPVPEQIQGDDENRDENANGNGIEAAQPHQFDAVFDGNTVTFQVRLSSFAICIPRIFQLCLTVLTLVPILDVG